MTYTFIHAFRDGTVGMCWMVKVDKQEEDEIHFDIQVPEGKPKRWHNEFLRWMNEAIIPQAEELENNISVQFQFSQH